MRKGFTLIELIIVMVVCAILFTISMFMSTETKEGEVKTVEVMCPLTTIESVRDTVRNVRGFDYTSAALFVFLSPNGSKKYPNTCIVREVTDGF